MTTTEESEKALQISVSQTQHLLQESSVPRPRFIRGRTVTILVAFLVLVAGMAMVHFSSPGILHRIISGAPMDLIGQPSGGSLKLGDHAIGIDLGTENVRVALAKHETIEVLPIKQKPNITPAWMQFRSNDTAADDWLQDSAQSSSIELMSLLFKQIKLDAEKYFEVPIGHAVVSVPFYFNDAKRQAVKDAGQLSGIQILRIANDPTLAGLGFEIHKQPGERNVLVVDYGFNLDVSLVSVDDGIFEILSTAGESETGSMDSEKPVGFNHPAFQRTWAYINQVLKDANITKDQIDDFLLLGGASQHPAVLRFLSEHLGKEPTSSNFPPSEAVVRGAAIQGGILSGIDSELCTGCTTWYLNTLTLGIETVGGIFTPIIQRNSNLPSWRQMNVSTTIAGHNQNGLDATINIYEGERGLVKDNRLLGVLDLGVLTPSSDGGPRIQITMELNLTNDVSVQARDLYSGKTAGLIIKEEKRLSYNHDPGSSDVIEAIILDAESSSETDGAIRRFFEAAMLNDALVESFTHRLDGATSPVDIQQLPLNEEQAGKLAFGYQEALEWFKNFGHTASVEELKRRSEAMQTLAVVHGSSLEQLVPPKIQVKER